MGGFCWELLSFAFASSAFSLEPTEAQRNGEISLNTGVFGHGCRGLDE